MSMRFRWKFCYMQCREMFVDLAGSQMLPVDFVVLSLI